jgi:hypothetical protein
LLQAHAELNDKEETWEGKNSQKKEL